MYQERIYRNWVGADGMVHSHVCRDESDLFILAREDVTDPAQALLEEVRRDLEEYIRRDEKFRTTLEPYQPAHDAPLIAARMAKASARYGVGPMAAVAGAIAECVGEQLASKVGDVVVENGGDIYVHSERPLTFTMYAGEESPFTGKLKFSSSVTGSYGVCTSSATVGHSKSFGKADAVCVVAKSVASADAAATALCNRIQCEGDIDREVETAGVGGEILGIFAVMGDRLGMWGNVEIVR